MGSIWGVLEMENDPKVIEISSVAGRLVRPFSVMRVARYSGMICAVRLVADVLAPCGVLTANTSGLRRSGDHAITTFDGIPTFY